MRVYVEGFGCAQNLGEADGIARAVAAAGHPVVADPAGADVGVLVTCGVIGATEARMVRRFHALAARLPRVVVTGCLVPLRTPLFTGPDVARATFVPTRDQASLPALLSSWAGGGPEAPAPGPGSGDAATAAEEVVIAQGCTSHCTYCFSRLARGRLTSVPPLDVLARVAAARDRGAVEIRLSSLDTSCWGEDRPAFGRLPSLLGPLLALPGAFRLRVGMMSPQSLAPIAAELFPLFAHPRLFRFLHLPVQSGSDAVLAAMRRGYTVADFRRLVAAARAAHPDLTLSTDLIVGFPGESESDFDSSLRLLESVGPEMVNVTRFSARPLTPAARLPPVAPGVAKRRSRAVTELRMRLARERLERWIGWEGDGLVVERGPEGSSVARLPNYLPVVLRERHALGAPVPVRIVGARSTYLLGRAHGPDRPTVGVALPA